MPDLGRSLIYLGLSLLALGVVISVVSRTGIPLGRLPGDISYRGRNASFSFPVVSCLLLSALASLVLWLLGRFRH